VARNVAALGGRAVLAGVVGADGAALGRMLQADGVEDATVLDPERATTVKTRFVAGQQQLLRLDVEERQTCPACGGAPWADCGPRRRSPNVGGAALNYANGAVTAACWTLPKAAAVGGRRSQGARLRPLRRGRRAEAKRSELSGATVCRPYDVED
jgi:hypothetical protein